MTTIVCALGRLASSALLAASLAGCATAPQASPGQAAAASEARDPRDPFEDYNRAIFAFNESVDEAVLKPLARGYQAVVPAPVRAGVDNFFANIGDLWSAANHFLQGKPQTGFPMLTRVGMNTVFGIGGLLDPASEAGLERQNEDFGQTLGRWGMPPGPYLVLPIFGPSTMRDGAAQPLDMWATSAGHMFQEPRDLNVLRALGVVSTRARLLGATKTLDEVALDKYILLRDGYLARRRNLVYDGDPPEEPEPKPPAAEAK